MPRMALFAQRLLYQALLWLVLPFIPPRLLLRGFGEHAYWHHVAERFGGGEDLPAGSSWIHAVSVGEVRAATPLIEHLLNQGKPVLLTCMTPAGRATAGQLFGSRIHLRYLPYDYAWAVRRFLRHTRPSRGIILETELWPNLIRTASASGLPLYLVNARLSERSAGHYRKFAALTQSVLGCFTAVAAQTADDAERLGALGARHPHVTGNLKFDVSVPPRLLELGAVFRARVGKRPVWLAASTREGEEKLILDAFGQTKVADALLLLVPRHPQRFEAVAQLARKAGFNVQLRSTDEPVAASTRVWLGDSLGELYAYYAAADSALIGGSLLPFGGQNLIEACAVGCPVLIGPHTDNFKQAVKDAIRLGAARRVDSAAAWLREAEGLSADTMATASMREAGKRYAAAHTGAARAVLALLEG